MDELKFQNLVDNNITSMKEIKSYNRGVYDALEVARKKAAPNYILETILNLIKK